MGKMKKILAALTAGVLCMGAVPLSAASLPEAVLSVSAAESTYENLTYTTEEDGTVTITGCSADVSGELELPAEIGGKSVTRIGDSAFQGNTAITGVSVPDSVTSIGDSAFAGCTALTHIDLPQTMTSFGREVFNTCTSTGEDHHSRGHHISAGDGGYRNGRQLVRFPCVLHLTERSAAAIYLENH